jgi:hypothetical protein
MENSTRKMTIRMIALLLSESAALFFLFFGFNLSSSGRPGAQASGEAELL